MFSSYEGTCPSSFQRLGIRALCPYLHEVFQPIHDDEDDWEKAPGCRTALVSSHRHQGIEAVDIQRNWYDISGLYVKNWCHPDFADPKEEHYDKDQLGDIAG